MGGFQIGHPDLAVRLVTGNEIADLRDGDADVAIRVDANGAWSDVHESLANLPRYTEWLQRQDWTDAYARHKQNLQLIGLTQSQWFDGIQVRVQARMRDTDVPASFTDAQATEAARKAPNLAERDHLTRQAARLNAAQRP